jgi:integrase
VLQRDPHGRRRGWHPQHDSEITRFLNAAEANFRKLASAALFSGARYGELCRLTVQDFNRKSGTLHIRKSKTGKERHVFLTEAGIAFFERINAGRPQAKNH